MECQICLEYYNLDSHIAIKLVCCHTLCLLCCNDQIKVSDKISCPQCFKVTEKSAIQNECETIKRIISGNSGGFNEDIGDIPQETSSFKVLLRNFRNRFVELTVQRQYTVAQLKELVEMVEGVEANSQWILFNGLSLENSRRLGEYNIVQGSILTLVMRSFGGRKNNRPWSI